MCRVGQNRIYSPHVTVYLVISLPKIPCIYTVYIWFWPTLFMWAVNYTARMIFLILISQPNGTPLPVSCWLSQTAVMLAVTNGTPFPVSCWLSRDVGFYQDFFYAVHRRFFFSFFLDGAFTFWGGHPWGTTHPQSPPSSGPTRQKRVPFCSFWILHPSVYSSRPETIMPQSYGAKT